MNIPKILAYINNFCCHNCDNSIISELLTKYEKSSIIEKNLIDTCFKGLTGHNINAIIILANDSIMEKTKLDEQKSSLNKVINKMSDEIELLKLVNKELKDNYWQLKQDINKTSMKN